MDTGGEHISDRYPKTRTTELTDPDLTQWQFSDTVRHPNGTQVLIAFQITGLETLRLQTLVSMWLAKNLL